MIDRIDNAIKNAKVTTHTTTKPDLLRIALMIKHGGVYMDATCLILDDFDWLTGIAKAPTEIIFNRYGVLPKLLMTYHTWYGHPMMWEFDH